MEPSNILIGVVGKTNVGKSTFFSAATETTVQIENRPFVTIEPNIGVGYLKKRCVHVELDLPRCDASNSICLNGWRMIPVKMMDVAGLVPGAHEGRGLGNKFLDHLRRADILLLIVDASGSTDPEGVPVKPGTYDPVEEVKQIVNELDEWMYSIIEKDWEKVARTIDASKTLDVPGALAQRLSGLSIQKHHVVEALEKTRLIDKKLTNWTREELRLFIRTLRKIAKPIVIVANKIDLPMAEENYKRLKKEFSDYEVIPASSAAELFLRKLAREGKIKYIPGDDKFEIIEESNIDPRSLKLLEMIDKMILKKYGSTGVQEALNTAVFKILDMITVYPVDDPNKYTDKQGRILPDVLLVKRGTTARELAYRIHTDLGETFIYAINAKTKQRVGEGYILQDGDVIKIVAAKR